MHKTRSIFLLATGAWLLPSCSKKDQQVTISSQQFVAGSFIQKGDTLNSKNGSNGRSIKGTLQSGQTYYLCSDFADATVNSSDTLVVQSGVKVLIVGPTTGSNAIGTEGHAPALLINGTFLCLGSKANPILFSVADASLRSNPANDPQDPNTDPAFKGYWGGIQGGAGSGDIIIKWTRLEYLGGIAPANAASRPGLARYGIFVHNPAANFVLEDCWLYGSNNDMVRPAGMQIRDLSQHLRKSGVLRGRMRQCQERQRRRYRL